jgi:hypothetical protein
MFVVSVVCCQVEVYATGRSLVQGRSTDYGVSLCVISKTARGSRLKPTGGCNASKIIIIYKSNDGPSNVIHL